jgi:hypothetical protein
MLAKYKTWTNKKDTTIQHKSPRICQNCAPTFDRIQSQLLTKRTPTIDWNLQSIREGNVSWKIIQIKSRNVRNATINTRVHRYFGKSVLNYPQTEDSRLNPNRIQMAERHTISRTTDHMNLCSLNATPTITSKPQNIY